MVDLVERAKAYCSTVGSGSPLTIGGAITGYAPFNSTTGLNAGDLLEYLIEDGTAWEIGTGTFASGGQLTRTLRSSSTGSLLSLSGNAIITLPVTASCFLAAFDNIGRNLVVNGRFTVNQRSATSTTANAAYLFDRWQLLAVLDTDTASVYTMTDADRAAVGDEWATSAIQIATTGNSGATAFSSLRTSIENVRRTAGKPFTLTFWAKQTTGSNTLGVFALQLFGSGGSSAVGAGTFSATLTSSWQKFFFTFTMPALTGQSVGSSGDCLYLYFSTSSGSNNAASYGTTVQSYTAILWGVQFEQGLIATPLEIIDPEIELQRCQRYFTYLAGNLHSGYAGAGATYYSEEVLPTPMRASPTVTFTTPTYTNSSALALMNASPTALRLQATAALLGTASALCDILLLAELG